MEKKTFTLFEMLISLTVLALIIGMLISIIKPHEIYKKIRDNQRISDLNYLETNIKTYLLNINTSSIYTTSTLNRVFLSIQLPSNATNTNCKNYFPDLPSLPSGWEYVCSKNPTSTDGTGWIPIDFRNYLAFQIQNLPLDPFNNSIYYYSFVASGSNFAIYAQLEDPRNQASKNDGDNYPYLYSVGDNKRLIDQAQGLVLYLPFDEGSGNIAYDKSGNGNNGTLLDASSTNADGNRPPQWVAGKVGGALSFDGVDDYVEVTGMTAKNALTYTQPFTISVWVKVSDIARRQIIQRAASANDRIFLLIESNRAVLGLYDGTVWTKVQSGAIISTNTWYHIVGVHRGNKVLEVWANGEKYISSSTLGYGYPWINIRIGSYSYYNNDWFQGIIDKIRIYNRALSDQEIKALYEATK